MNQHFRRILCQALIVTALYGSDYPLATADPEHASRIAVVFVEPENFTDVERPNLNQTPALSSIPSKAIQSKQRVPAVEIDGEIASMEVIDNFHRELR